MVNVDICLYQNKGTKNHAVKKTRIKMIESNKKKKEGKASKKNNDFHKKGSLNCRNYLCLVFTKTSAMHLTSHVAPSPLTM